ncbi:ACT domain-containing protein [Aliikangiella sp. G2MR2-5]|uniref:ACT domain-containing protein n=1 Tax=Aliikangiella sp. G2MR2-5 TaxID=2788943 RepID=UPI0018A9B1BA|nr:ACT domain-containing protein [Aliikangiella sp. G2MR2-5]
MAAIENIKQLLRSMSPALAREEYVFCSIKATNECLIKQLTPLATFREQEGITFVIDKKQAGNMNLEFSSTFRKITLKVHSSLNAVGLTAAVSGALAKENISANVIAAFYHDHIFVPAKKAEHALEVLQRLAETQ